MTRKHYIAIAKIISSTPVPASSDAQQTLEIIATELASFFKQESAAFDKQRFMDACLKK